MVTLYLDSQAHNKNVLVPFNVNVCSFLLKAIFELIFLPNLSFISVFKKCFENFHTNISFLF